MTRILCFGDSITAGNDDAGGGWPLRLKNELAKIYITDFGVPTHDVYNLGNSAENSNGLLKRFESELVARKTSHEPVIIIACGMNDSAADEKGDVQVEGETYAQNLEDMISIAKNHTNKILVLGILPVQDEKMNPAVFDKNYFHSNARTRAYNVLAKRVSERKKVDFVDLNEVFGKLSFDIYTTDGMHPSSAGYQYIADSLNKKVAEMANDYASKDVAE